jgi:hypothetical protein
LAVWFISHRWCCYLIEECHKSLDSCLILLDSSNMGHLVVEASTILLQTHSGREGQMKKGKLNPDRYKIAGGAPVDEKLEQRRTKTITKNRPNGNQRKRVAKRPTAVNRTAGPTAKSRNVERTGRRPLGQTNQQTSQKTGKRSDSQKRQNTRYGTEAMPATRLIDGAFGREPTQRNRREIP